MERDAVLASQESLFNMCNLSRPTDTASFRPPKLSRKKLLTSLKGQIRPSCEGEAKEDDASSLIKIYKDAFSRDVRVGIRPPDQRVSWAFDFCKTCEKIL
jgi:hypothetical protein